ncbi:hypothetical protein VP137E351_P0061 [Vibrio phage 137E35-1]|nr:hypothetical protein VP137E351_P0061 [Vibrio phage 137E35-1]CAH9016568.1 hypothetical protein VP230E391_P0061 [Vibrio phage 230E39-1]
MSHDNDTEEMTSRELQRDMQTMTNSITQLSENISKLVESDIRRQERDLRQQEFNDQIRDRVHDLEDWKQDIVISRAKESQGRDILMKYWPLLLLIGSIAAFKLMRLDLSTILG